jgi:hypothetical protein
MPVAYRYRCRNQSKPAYRQSPSTAPGPRSHYRRPSRRGQIAIALAAPSPHTSRGFLVWGVCCQASFSPFLGRALAQCADAMAAIHGLGTRTGQGRQPAKRARVARALTRSIPSPAWRNQLSCQTIRAEPCHGRGHRATTLYSVGPRTRTMMQSCASVAKLRSGGPILPYGVKAKELASGNHHLKP